MKKYIFFDVDIVLKNKSKCGVAWSVLCASWVHNILIIVMTGIVVDKGTDQAKPKNEGVNFLRKYGAAEYCKIIWFSQLGW